MLTCFAGGESIRYFERLPPHSVHCDSPFFFFFTMLIRKVSFRHLCPDCGKHMRVHEAVAQAK